MKKIFSRFAKMNEQLHNYEHTVAWTRSELVILAVLLLSAFLLRVYQIMNSTGSVLTGDEIFDSHIEIYRILTGQQTYNGWANYTYFLLVWLWNSFFGFSMLGVRYMSAFFGVVSILFGYLLIRDNSGKTVAFMATALLVCSVFHIHFSKLAMVNIYASAFTMMFLFFYQRSFSSTCFFYPIAAGISIVLGMFGLSWFHACNTSNRDYRVLSLHFEFQGQTAISVPFAENTSRHVRGICLYFWLLLLSSCCRLAERHPSVSRGRQS